MTKFKTNNYKASALTKMRVAVLITAAILALAFIGCKQPVGAKSDESGTSTHKHKVTFSVVGTPANGTLTAKVGSAQVTSGNTVEQGKTITFTAKANAGYRVKGWTLDGKPITEAGTNTEYKLTVTKSAIVSVSFEISPVEGGAVLVLSPDKLNIRVKAVTADGSAIQVEGCDETTLESGVDATLYAKGKTVILKGKITELYCTNNQLTELNVQGLTALQLLDCYNNQLVRLGVQDCTSLQQLQCSKNQLTALDVQGSTALQKLGCYNNQLKSLNVQGLTSLQELGCFGNTLTALNVQGLTALQKLGCSGNKLTALDVQGCSSLQELDCKENQLASLDVQGCTVLQELDCHYNKLIRLGVQGLTSLQRLDCSDNKLVALNVSGCTALEGLDCSGNQINAKAMTALLNVLPAHEASDDAEALLYTEKTGVGEGNCKDFTNPPELKASFEGAKGRIWKLKKINAGGDEVEI